MMTQLGIPGHDALPSVCGGPEKSSTPCGASASGGPALLRRRRASYCRAGSVSAVR